MTLALLAQPVDLSPTTGANIVFVGGLHRSGTSLLAGALGSADGATGLVGTGFAEDEGHYLHSVIPSAYQLGGPGRFAFHPEANLGPSSTPKSDYRRLVQAWEPYWADSTAAVRVEKSPQNLIQGRWLRSVFPDSNLVMIIRHPATVALATKKWTRPGPRGLRRAMPTISLRQLITHWLWAHHLMAQDQARLNSIRIVRFEDLVDPQADHLNVLAADLGLGVLEDLKVRERVEGPSYNDQWCAWRKTSAARKAERTWLPMAEAAMHKWGYSIDDRLI